jgi:hypothetical protein
VFDMDKNNREATVRELEAYGGPLALGQGALATAW